MLILLDGRKRVTAFALPFLVLVLAGCRQEAGRWDDAQARSEGKTAQQSSADRMATGSGPQELDTEPPPYTPDASREPSGQVDWAPKEIRDAAGGPSESDLADLTSGAPVPGGQLNRFFPEQSGDYDRVAKQEKEGFAEYSLRLGGEEIGQLSITDLRSNPQAATKFQQPDMEIAGYPAKKDGSKGTTLLVANRFQVKVRSPAGQLNEPDRVKWLQKFDLEGLAELGQ